MQDVVAESPTLQIGAVMGLRLLALVVDAKGAETYRVSVRATPGDPFVAGALAHVAGDEWELWADGARGAVEVTWASPDSVFALALGHDATADARVVTESAPHWPAAVLERLAARGLSGPGTVAFDGRWFLTELASSSLEHPLLLTDAAAKLGLTGLERAAATLHALAPALAVAQNSGEATASGLPQLLLGALDAQQPANRRLDWQGDGRLIGEFPEGDLVQLGTDLADGCRLAERTGPLEVVFSAAEALGLGLGPRVYADAAVPTGGAQQIVSVGTGCVVGVVDPGGAADRAGLLPGMALSHLSYPNLPLPHEGPDAVSFEAVLDAIDSRRSEGRPLSITFDTAAPVTHLYAVELPAAAAIRALAGTVKGGPRMRSRDVGVGASLDALCGRDLIWRERTPRLFLGDPGSVTSAHTDMCPQVQMTHALCGTKLLGVAAHHATPRLAAEHAAGREGEDGDLLEHEATTVSTDGPLTPRASRLLGDPSVSIALLRAGDLAVFDSGALHFASNGADAVSGAVYHGMITPGAIPRLRVAASADVSLSDPHVGAYSDHLFASELLRLVQGRLAKWKNSAG